MIFVRALSLAVGSACLLIGTPIPAQQLPDRNYHPPVHAPTWSTGKGPTVCVDEAHYNFHTLDDRFWAFGELLRRDGYVTVPSSKQFTGTALEFCQVLVISNAQLSDAEWDTYPYPTPSGFTPAEIQAVHAWVQNGGSLLLIADHMPLSGVASMLAARFEVTFNNGFAFERVDLETGQPTDQPTLFRIEDSTLRPHAITRGRHSDESVTRIRTFTGQAFLAPATASPILVLSGSFVSLMPEIPWQFSRETKRLPVGGWLQGAVMTVGSGKAAFFGEAAMFSAQVGGPQRRPAGMNAPMAEQNFQFVLNLMHWLTGQLE